MSRGPGRRRSHSTHTLYRILVVLGVSCVMIVLGAAWAQTWLPFTFLTTLKLFVLGSIIIGFNVLINVGSDHR